MSRVRRMTGYKGMIQFIHVVAAVLETASCCRYVIDSSNGLTGTFTSPGYPDIYPTDIRCTYIIQGTHDERINITFVEFDLEPGTRAGCLYDYIDIYAVSLRQELDHQERLCGSGIPEPVISIHQKLEVVFKSDKHQTQNRGFKALYKFIDERWQPFPESSPACGSNYIRGVGGVLTSPGFPEPYKPGIECTWMIRVEDTMKITINFLVLDMGQSVTCTHSFLALYNGFASPDVEPDEIVCGQLYFFNSKNRKEFKGTTFRMIVRFKSGDSNEYSGRGFKIAWTAVGLPRWYNLKPGAKPCPEFHCKGGEYCIDTSGLLCNALQRYCIADVLRCNGIPNCGAYDHSDEEGCATKAILLTFAVVVPVCLIVSITTGVVMCRRRRRRLLEKTDDMTPNGDHIKHRDSVTKYLQHNSDSSSYAGATNHIYASVPSSDVTLRHLDKSPSTRRCFDAFDDDAGYGPRHDCCPPVNHVTVQPVIQYGGTPDCCASDTEQEYLSHSSTYGSQASLRHMNKVPPTYRIVYGAEGKTASVSATV